MKKIKETRIPHEVGKICEENTGRAIPDQYRSDYWQGRFLMNAFKRDLAHLEKIIEPEDIESKTKETLLKWVILTRRSITHEAFFYSGYDVPALRTRIEKQCEELKAFVKAVQRF